MNKSLTLTLTMPAELKKRIERETKIPERSVPAWDSLERVSQAGRAKFFLCPPLYPASESGDAALISFMLLRNENRPRCSVRFRLPAPIIKRTSQQLKWQK